MGRYEPHAHTQELGWLFISNVTVLKAKGFGVGAMFENPVDNVMEVEASGNVSLVIPPFSVVRAIFQ